MTVPALKKINYLKYDNVYVHSIDLFSRGYRLYTSESDVYRRQILKYKDRSRTEKNKLFATVVDPYMGI